MEKSFIIRIIILIVILSSSLYGVLWLSQKQHAKEVEYAEMQKKRQAEREDSIARVDGDSIIGPYKFGMTKHEVDSIWKALENSVRKDAPFKEEVRQYYIISNVFLLAYPKPWCYVNGKLAMMELKVADQENNDNPYWHDGVPFHGDKESFWKDMTDSIKHTLERKYGANRDSTYKSYTYGLPHKAYQIIEKNVSNSRMWVGVMKLRIFRPSMYGKTKNGEYSYNKNWLDEI